jgi:hypothetical protein
VTRKFRLAQAIEDAVDFFARKDVVQTADHSVKRGNHPDNEFTPQQ